MHPARAVGTTVPPLMRTLTYYVATTLDGFIAASDGSVDFFTFEGDFAETILAEYPETMPVQARSLLGLADTPNRHFDTVVMGRGTYQPALEVGITSPYPHLRQVVFSRTLAATDPEVEIVAGDPAAFVRDLKSQDGQGIWLCGGGKLAAQLVAEIDELVVKCNPIVLGSGIPLFDGEPAATRFTLNATRSFDTGVVMSTYTPA
jgi:dihydrofolate reductase